MKKLFSLAVVFAMMAGLMAFTGAQAQDEPATFPIKIRFLNAMTAQQTLDVYINGDDDEQRVVEGLEYGTFSADFDGTSPATEILIKRNVEFGFDQWIFNTIVPTQPGNSYIVVLSDFVVIPVEVDLSSTAEIGSRGHFIHAASQAPPVDVVVDGDVVTSSLQYGRAGSGGPVVAGTYDVTVNQAGTSTVAVDLPGSVVEAGNAYTYVLIGEPGSTEEPLTVVVDSQPLAEDAA